MLQVSSTLGVPHEGTLPAPVDDDFFGDGGLGW